jgi:hypothetical protein
MSTYETASFVEDEGVPASSVRGEVVMGCLLDPICHSSSYLHMYTHLAG